MHRGAALLLAIPLGAWPAPAEALQVEVRREVDFYDVRGTTGDEVLESLLAAAPRHEGRRWWGYTSTSVRWRFRWARSGRYCRITDARIQLGVEITLPRWHDRERAEPPLRARWDEMVASLREHEQGHAEIAERGARRVHRELLGTAEACRGIEEMANQVARRAWGRTRPEQERYDEETRRGRTQGVVWSGRARARSGTASSEGEPAGRSGREPVPSPERDPPSPAELGSIPAEGPGEFLDLPERRSTMRLDRWTDRCPVRPWYGPAIVRRPEGDFLELCYCLSPGSGCRPEFYCLREGGAEGWTYIRPARREELEAELPARLVPGAGVRIDLRALEGQVDELPDAPARP